MTTSSIADPAKSDWHSQAEAVRWKIQPFIGGEYRSSATEETYENIDPATETPLCHAPAGDAGDVDDAVASARRCFEEHSWSGLPPVQRGEVLRNLADLIGQHRVELALLDTLEVGKPIQAALWDAETFATSVLRSWAAALEHLTGASLPLMSGSAAFNVWAPRGVVAAITAWNFPSVNAVYKLGPALAAGNTVVLKPSELSPSSALKIAELALEAGLPPGALNVVPGLGSIAGEALASHHDVDFLSFTGSTATGGRIMESAGRSNAKPIILECGGKSPQVVFNDSGGLDVISKAILQDAFFNQGQVCAAHSRLIVHREVKDELLERMVGDAGDYVPAPPLEDSTTFGPLASPAQRDRVRGYIQQGLDAGAEPVLKGEVQSSGGCYVSPTIFDGVTPSMSIVQEEIFGPVLCIQTFESDEEAIALANGTGFGLAATVWTRDLGRAKRMAYEINSGALTIRSSADEPPDAGIRSGMILAGEPQKASGFGAEVGVEGLKSYSTLKAIYINGS